MAQFQVHVLPSCVLVKQIDSTERCRFVTHFPQDIISEDNVSSTDAGSGVTSTNAHCATHCGVMGADIYGGLVKVNLFDPLFLVPAEF